MDKKKLIAIMLVAVLSVAVLVPILILRRSTPLSLSIISPNSTTYTSETTQITVNLEARGDDLDTVWYRIYNETDSAWIDPSNVTWTTATTRTLGQGGVFTLYAWANDSSGNLKAATIQFTMYKLVIIESDTAFPNGWTVGEYEKYILRNSQFSVGSPYVVYVDGILEMESVTWSSSLHLDAHSAVSAIDSTFGYLYFNGDVVTTLRNVTITEQTSLYENANVTCTNATFVGTIYTYQNSSLTITDSSIYRFSAQEDSQVSVSYCTASEYSYLMDSAIVVVKNYTSPSRGIEVYGNGSATIINSTLNYVYLALWFSSGDWIIDQNIISGSGTRGTPTINIINSDIDNTWYQVDAYGSTNLLVNDTTLYDWYYTYDSSNLTLCGSTLEMYIAYDDSNATIIHSTISEGIMVQSNGTFYFEDITTNYIRSYYYFYGGDITGFNDTFVGAESWTFPKVTLGPDVSYSSYRYVYYIENEVNFALSNTSEIYRLYARDSANVSIYSCMTLGASPYFYATDNANITFYYSEVYYVSGENDNNITLYNTSCYQLHLHQTSFADIIAYSHVVNLYLYDTAGYYKSPESTIDNIYT
jgi:hypothetical protein